MASQFQPLTLQVTTPLRGLRTRLLAAWPHGPQRLRAIKTIARHIKDTLPAGYNGDISVFLSNEAKTIAEPITQGFLYHLAQHHVVTRQIVKKTNNPALLHVHVTTAQAIEEANEDELDAGQATGQTPLVSRIEQIKQWQKETVKAMFQAMADTAITMEAQTSLRGAMAGLNKLAALLNKATSAHKQARTPAKGTLQKTSQQTVMRDISSTLSDLRSNLSAASHNGSLKPPTKAQLVLRQQLNKLDKITQPARAPIKTAQAKVPKATTPLSSVKPAVAKTASPKLSARAIPSKPTAPVTTRRIAQIAIKPLALRVATQTVPTLTSHIKINAPRIATRHVSIPARIVARISAHIVQRAASIPQQRFTAASTKTIIQKIADKPALRPVTAAGQQSLITPIRTVTHFQISRPRITQLRITPSVIRAYHAQQTNMVKLPPSAKTDIIKPETKSIRTVEIKQTAAPAIPAIRTPVQSLGSKIPLRVTRAPAVYSGLVIAAPLTLRASVSYSQSALPRTSIAPIAVAPRTPQTSPTGITPVIERAIPPVLPAPTPTPTPVITPAPVTTQTSNHPVAVPPTPATTAAPLPTTTQPPRGNTPSLPRETGIASPTPVQPTTGENTPRIITVIAQRNEQPTAPDNRIGAATVDAPPAQPAQPTTTNTVPQPAGNPIAPAHIPDSNLAQPPTTPPATPPVLKPDTAQTTATGDNTRSEPIVSPSHPSHLPKDEPKDILQETNVVPFPKQQPDGNTNNNFDPTPNETPRGKLLEFKEPRELKRPPVFNPTEQNRAQWVDRDRRFVQIGNGSITSFMSTDFTNEISSPTGGGRTFADPFRDTKRDKEEPKKPNRIRLRCPCTGRLLS